MTEAELDDLAKQDGADDYGRAMKSACGEYECPCHDKLPILVAEVRRLRGANADLLAVCKRIVAGGMCYPKYDRDLAATAIAKAIGPAEELPMRPETRPTYRVERGGIVIDRDRADWVVLQNAAWVALCCVKADAESIASALNAYPALVEALEAALAKFEEYYPSRSGAEPDAMRKVRAALSLTKPKE